MIKITAFICSAVILIVLTMTTSQKIKAEEVPVINIISQETENADTYYLSETEELISESSYIETTEIITETQLPKGLELRNDGNFFAYETDKEFSLTKLNSIIDSYNKVLSVSVCLPDFNTGFYYNVNNYYYGASLIKLPFLYYVATLVDSGKIDLDDRIEYTPDDYIGGTGYMQNEKTGTYWSVSQLIDKILYNSDNVAYKMLYRYIGYQDFINILKDNGFYTDNDDKNIFGSVSAEEMIFFWNKLYSNRYISEIYDVIIKDAVTSKFSPIRNALLSQGRYYNVGNKNGWSGQYYHDSAIVYGATPYIVVIMTNSEGENEDEQFMYNLVIEIDNVINEYCNME